MGMWLWNAITGALGNISDSLKGIGSWIWSKITGAVGSIGGKLFRGKGEGQVGIPFVPGDGLYKLHRGEQVIPRGQTSNKSMIFKPTFQITGNVSQDIDMDAIVRRAGRMTEMELKKRGIL